MRNHFSGITGQGKIYIIQTQDLRCKDNRRQGQDQRAGCRSRRGVAWSPHNHRYLRS